MDHQTFRPNIVIESEFPFGEERLGKGKIGENLDLKFVGGCPRCVQISQNQQKKDEHSNVDWEPLTTLKKYHMEAEREAPIFGVYAQAYLSKPEVTISKQEPMVVS